jgi:hypothetical protein
MIKIFPEWVTGPWQGKFLVGKLKEMRQLGRTRRRWEYNIKMDLQEVECGIWTKSSRLKIETGGEHL